MDFKTDALLLRSVDFGENDKIVTLLTAARGKLGASVKGVKKAGAKLKFAAQPFCFAEYVLAQKNARHTVISASLYDGFFALREDVGAFYAASAVCEVCDKLTLEGMDCAELLVCAVTALKEMCEGEVSFALVRFLLESLRLSGYPVRAENCPSCGKRLLGRMRFDMESGAFGCEECGKGAPASEITYQTVRAALEGEKRFEDERRKEGEKRALRLLSAYYNYQIEVELSALKEYIALI